MALTTLGTLTIQQFGAWLMGSTDFFHQLGKNRSISEGCTIVYDA